MFVLNRATLESSAGDFWRASGALRLSLELLHDLDEVLDFLDLFLAALVLVVVVTV